MFKKSVPLWLHALALLLVLLAGCASDPQYLTFDEPLQGGQVDAMQQPVTAKTTINLPIEIETATDRAEREALATKLGVPVAYVRLSDIEVSVEWILRNPGDLPGVANVTLNGGNDRFFYDPTLIPTNDEEPSPPSLLGNTPIMIKAKSEVRGLFREDELLEASIDLELISRANQNPFRAILQVNEADSSIQPLSTPDPADPNSMPMPVGDPVSRQALAQLTRLDLGLVSSTSMTLTYAVRIRDLRGIVHTMLNDAPAGELTMFSPVVFIPGM
jgi:hypothetical protein